MKGSHYAKLTVSKDEWDPSKSMKNVLYVLQYAKRYFSGQSIVE